MRWKGCAHAYLPTYLPALYLKKPEPVTWVCVTNPPPVCTWVYMILQRRNGGKTKTKTKTKTKRKKTVNNLEEFPHTHPFPLFGGFPLVPGCV